MSDAWLERARFHAGRMAIREARLLLRQSRPSVALTVQPLVCPRCDADATGFADRLIELKFRDIELNMASSAETATLVMLACERLPVRSLLALATDGETSYRVPQAPLLTRAAAVALMPAHSPDEILVTLDRAEQWADADSGPRSWIRPVLPSATRLHHAVTDRPPAMPHFVTPHHDPHLDRLNLFYLARRREIVEQTIRPRNLPGSA